MDNKIPEIENRLIQNKSEIETLKTSIKAFETSVKEIKDSFHTFEGKINGNFKKVIDELSGKIQSVNTALSTFETNTNKKLELTKEDIEKLNTSLTSVTKQIADFQEKVTNANLILTGEVAKVSKQLNQLTSEINKIDVKRLETIVGNLTEFETKFNDKFAEINKKLKRNNRLIIGLSVLVVVLFGVSSFYITKYKKVKGEKTEEIGKSINGESLDTEKNGKIIKEKLQNQLINLANNDNEKMIDSINTQFTSDTCFVGLYVNGKKEGTKKLKAHLYFIKNCQVKSIEIDSIKIDTINKKISFAVFKIRMDENEN